MTGALLLPNKGCHIVSCMWPQRGSCVVFKGLHSYDSSTPDYRAFPGSFCYAKVQFKLGNALEGLEPLTH